MPAVFLCPRVAVGGEMGHVGFVKPRRMLALGVQHRVGGTFSKPAHRKKSKAHILNNGYSQSVESSS